MPRPAKGPRLWLRRSPAPAVWIIKDGGRQYRTGCGAADRAEAERRLGLHIAEKYAVARRERDLDQIRVADVLNVYMADVVPGHAAQAATSRRIDRLLDYFGALRLNEINGESCRAYAAHRAEAERQRRQSRAQLRTSLRPDTAKVRTGGARRDLEDLRAAISHHAAEGLHRGVVRVALPQQGKPRQRWLTRAEAARLIWTCHTARETQAGAKTAKAPLRHLVRFLLLGLYTGSRPGVLLTAAWDNGPGRSWIDVERGLFYRLPDGQIETNKRQPPVPLPPQILRLLKRWKRQDGGRGHVVRFAGQPVASVKTAMNTAVRLAGLTAADGTGAISAYTLRHTAATWLMHADVSIWMAARFLGTSPEIIEKNYAHHAPGYLQAAANALGGRRNR